MQDASGKSWYFLTQSNHYYSLNSHAQNVTLLPKLKHGLKIIKRHTAFYHREVSQEATVNDHQVFPNFCYFLTVTKRSVSKQGFTQFRAGTHILSMHFHSNLNPFKSELLQQKFLTSDHNSALSCTKLCTHCQKK